jgi:hypothetical protein
MLWEAGCPEADGAGALCADTPAAGTARANANDAAARRPAVFSLFFIVKFLLVSLPFLYE